MTDKHAAVLEAFFEVFGAYEYQFVSSDALLEKRDEGGRKNYYEQAKTLVQHEVLQQEIKEWKRGLYAKLALISMDDVNRTAYRATLLAIVEFEKRLQSLAALSTKTEMKKIVDRL